MRSQVAYVRRPAVVGFALIVLGAMLVFGMLLVRPIVPSWLPLPLGELECVAVDSRGDVYCSSGFYQRIQVYSPEGRYLRGWYVPGVIGWSIRTNESDRIEVVTRGEAIQTYSGSGTLLETWTPPPDFEPDMQKVHDQSYNKCTDTAGRIYSVRAGLVYPHVIRRDKDGSTRTVVSPPRLSWFLMAPFPAFLYIAIGFALVHWSQRKRGCTGSSGHGHEKGTKKG